MRTAARLAAVLAVVYTLLPAVAYGGSRAAAALRTARIDLQHGRYAGALSGARKAGGDDAALAVDARTTEAEAERALGHYADAQRALEALVAAHPDAFRARYLLGLVYRETGQRDRAAAIWNAFFDDYNGGVIDKTNAEQLLYVAESARYTEDYEDANDTFRDATRAAASDPAAKEEIPEINDRWGELFLEKYAAPEARKSFAAALAANPDDPDALAGMAQVELDESNDAGKAEPPVARALAVNPRHVAALALRARLAIDDEDYATADAALAPALAGNPTVSRWLALSAAARYFLDDAAGFAAREKQALAQNPTDSSFYHTLAELCVAEHRYPEALDFDRKALALDPEDWAALAGLGQSWLRLGDEQKGYEELKKAWGGDRYNVRTYNLLNLYEDVIPKKYTFTAEGHFRLLTAQAEKAILDRYVPRQLEAELAALSRKYGFTPETPVTVELFDDPSAYAVRTVGVPGLGALGVCFGKVITALSPSTGNLNWGMVLWHEEAHVFAIAISRGRVPRWFTEGLSEYETRAVRPEWRRTNDFDLYAAMKSGRLRGLAALNQAFTHARDMDDMTLAYQQSALTVDYLARTYGFPKIVLALRLWGEGKPTPEVLRAVTGRSLAELDRAVREDLAKRFAVYDGQWYVEPADYADLDARKAAAAKAPGDSVAQAALAVALLVSGDAKAAATQADRTLALDPKQREALFVTGALALRDKDRERAREAFQKIVATGASGYELHERLCELQAAGGDVTAAEAECAQAKRLDPEQEAPYQALAALYDELGRTADAEAALEPAALLDPMGWDTYRKLVAWNAAAARWDKVREFGEMALRVNPFDAELHYRLGQAYANEKRWDDAIFEERSALLCKPEQAAPIEVALGEALLGKGDRAGAERAAADALAADPGSAEAAALAKRAK